MYLGKYPDPTELPPGYRGVAIPPPPVEREVCAPCAEAPPSPVRANFLDVFLSHHLDFEDLLLLGLILMLLWSGADIECVLMLGLLFILGL